MKPLSLYVHIPFCVKKCAYCDFLSFPAGSELKSRYLEALLREIESYSKSDNMIESMNKADGRADVAELNMNYVNRAAGSVFFGGGTPSVLGPEGIGMILDALKATFGKGYEEQWDKAEISMELNPGTVTEQDCNKLCKLGINRFSIGLQSTDDKELARIGRIHRFEEFLNTYKWLRRAGAKNINIDLMSALPGQSKESFVNSLHKITDLDPEHISVYSLILEEGTPLYRFYNYEERADHKGDNGSGPDVSVPDDKVRDVEYNIPVTMESTAAVNITKDYAATDRTGISPEWKLPDEDEEREMYELTGEILGSAGYRRYEISNYAKPGFECRHNVVYWKRGDYLGLGLGASSCVNDVRWKNKEDIEDYIASVDIISEGEVQILSEKDRMEETMFLGLRMMEGVNLADFSAQFGVSAHDVYGSVIEKYISSGFLKIENGNLMLTQKGIDVSNTIFADFLL